MSLIGIDIEGITPLVRGLHNLPGAIRDEAGDAVAKYLRNVLQNYPPQKRVPFREAYGPMSAKQRRFFFAALKRGEITVPYKRTQTLRNNWEIVGAGETAILVNETPYAHLVMGEGEQARMMEMIGWKTTDAVVEEREARISEVAEGAAKRAIRKVGL
jgi:hypothetical protein